MEPTLSGASTLIGPTAPDEYETRCGSWMPRAKTWCYKDPHPTSKPHMTEAAVSHDRERQREVNRAAYETRMSNPDIRQAELEYQKTKYGRRSAMIAHIKLMMGCTDCGYNQHPAALEFDHLPGSSKHKAVSLLLMGSLAKVFAEIDKCEVVCSNCHRIRTTERDQWRFPWKT